MKYSVLVVEDRKDLAELLQHHLEKAGYNPHFAFNGEEALNMVSKEKYDLILLDLMLPKLSGIEILKRLKLNEKTKDIPIIIESAKSDDEDVILGLELGAEDYVTKPFSSKVLLARIQKIMQRQKSHLGRTITSYNGKVRIDLDSHEVWIENKPINLTLAEYGIFISLVQNHDKIMSRDKLLDEVWQNKSIVVDRVIDVHMNSLRKKLGSLSTCIQTIRGVGYMYKSNG